MEIRLESLKMENFQGLKSFTFSPNGSNVSVFGRNAAGKSTIFNAFTFLLFGKNSENRADFEIKPIGSSGIDVSVESSLSIDGSPLTLKKIYKEKWSKKRGSATSEFTGHSTEHFIDSVPVQEKEYKAKIAELATDEIFKLLTNPRHFSENIKWQDRRRILLEVCGGITDAQVIEANPELSKLPEILNGKSIDDVRKILAGQKTEINRELTQIPARIDEQSKSLVEASGDIGKIKFGIGILKNNKAEQEQILATLKAGGQLAEKTVELKNLQGLLIELDNEQAKERNSAGIERGQNLLNARKALNLLKAQEDDLRTVFEKKASDKTKIESRMEELRAEFGKVVESSCQPTTKCFACGQEIPEGKQKEQIEAFNQDKAKKQAAINETGKELRQKASKYEEELKPDQSALDELAALIQESATVVSQYEKAVSDPSPGIVSKEDDEKRQALFSRREEIEAEISLIRENRSTAVDETKAKIIDLDTKIEAELSRIHQIESNQKIHARIDELKSQERELAMEFEKVEGKIFLTEEFLRAKVRMLEEQINGKFNLIGFRLFEQQINGALNEVCEISINGVPYSSANNASRLNAGIEMCNSLSEHYGVSLPMFLDNCEAITDPIPSRGQQIRLYVSKNDETLRIETEKENVRTAKAAR
jgi:DNA repair exonuclease SbcCD ATPase subunit